MLAPALNRCEATKTLSNLPNSIDVPTSSSKVMILVANPYSPTPSDNYSTRQLTIDREAFTNNVLKQTTPSSDNVNPGLAPTTTHSGRVIKPVKRLIDEIKL